MKTTDVVDVLRQFILHPTGGVVGMVDELLTECAHGLELDWQSNSVRVRNAGGIWEELTDLDVRQSVFRAVLARLAVLCNEQVPGSVSPHGGAAKLSVRGNPADVVRIRFANTLAEQRLELAAEPGRGDANLGGR